jgi:hypothetical protein
VVVEGSLLLRRLWHNSPVIARMLRPGRRRDERFAIKRRLALHQPLFVVLGLILFIGGASPHSMRCRSKPSPMSPTRR